MTASLELHFYGIKLKTGFHSVVEFASPVFLTDDEEGGGEITNFRLNGIWSDFILFTPGGYYRPIMNNRLFEEYPINEKYNNVSTLDEILYFPMDPLTLQSELKMTLYASGNIYHLQLRIVQKGSDDMDFRLLSEKIFPRWKSQINKRFSLYQNNESVLNYECLKLNQSDYIMKKMVEIWHNDQKKNIEKTHLTPIQNGINDFQFKRSIFLLKELIYSVTEIFREYFSRRGLQLPKYRKIIGIEEEEKEEKGVSNFLFPIEISKVQQRFRDAREEEEFDENSKKDFTDKLRSIMGKLKADISKDEIFDNRCCITFNSTIRDLLDTSILDLFHCGKKAFLWYFTVTGIPILTTMTTTTINNDADDTRANVWKMRLRLSDESFKYPIVSHNIVVDNNNNCDDHSSAENIFKKIETKRQKINGIKLDEKMEFNAIVPIFKPKITTILKPLIKTNVFASLCTFSILNNPNAVYSDVHFVALLRLWIKYINFKEQGSYIRETLESIYSIAAVYLEDHPDYATYKRMLINSPEWALTEDVDGERHFKVESENLVKPLFFMFIYREEIEMKKIIRILELLVRELVSRLVSKLLRVISLERARRLLFVIPPKRKEKEDEGDEEEGHEGDDEEEEKDVVDADYSVGCRILKRKYIRLGEEMGQAFLTGKHYNYYLLLEKNNKMLAEILKIYCRETFSYDLNLINNFVGLNVKKLFRWTDDEDIGGFSLQTLKIMATRQFNLPEDAVNQIFDEKHLFRCVYYSLHKRKLLMKSILRDDLISYEDAFEGVAFEIREDFRNIVIGNMIANLKSGIPRYFTDKLHI